jgi:hypothetical protein
MSASADDAMLRSMFGEQPTTEMPAMYGLMETGK